MATATLAAPARRGRRRGDEPADRPSAARRVRGATDRSAGSTPPAASRCALGARRPPHRDGAAVMPGTGVPRDRARGVARPRGGRRPVEIRDIAFLAPLAVAAGEERTLRVEVRAPRRRLRVRGEERRRGRAARARRARSLRESAPRPPAIAALESVCTRDRARRRGKALAHLAGITAPLRPALGDAAERRLTAGTRRSRGSALEPAFAADVDEQRAAPCPARRRDRLGAPAHRRLRRRARPLRAARLRARARPRAARRFDREPRALPRRRTRSRAKRRPSTS